MPSVEILEHLITEIRALDDRERELARMAEQLTLDARIQQAETLGRQLERDRVLRLIDAQLEQLQRGGLNALSLRHLRAAIQEAAP